MKYRKSLALGLIPASVLVLGAFMACSSSDNDTSDPGWSGLGGEGGAGGEDSGAGTSGQGGSGGTILFEGGTGGTPDLPDGFDPDGACAATTHAAKLEPANMLFLIDRTGSMNCNPPPDQTTAQCSVRPEPAVPSHATKWQIIRDALNGAVTDFEDYSPLPSVGVMFFNNNDACGVPSSPDVPVDQLSGTASTDSQLDDFLNAVNAVVPKGDTPIIGSLMSAYGYLQAHSSEFAGNKFVVLLTDGAETCDLREGMKEALVSSASQASQLVGIRTFVLGAPGSESERAFLSQIAFAGGTARSANCDHSGSDPSVGDCHLDMTLPGMDFASELQENLDAINGEALSCEFDVPTGPDGVTDYSKVNVTYSSQGGDPITFPQDTTKACSDPRNRGWQYNADKTKILLCGLACDQVHADPHASISIEIGCVTQVVVR